MKETLYPKLLVALQFGIIALMVYLAHSILSLVPIVIFLLGLSIGLWAISHNQIGNFNIEPELKDDCQLITTGIYRWVRHPMYTSVIFMMLGVLLSNPSLYMFLFFVALIVVLLLKAKREESLWLRHDKCYEAYKEKTKYFIPYIL